MKSILVSLILLFFGLVPGAGARPNGYQVIGYLQTYLPGINVDLLPYGNLTHISEAFALPEKNGTVSFSGSRPHLIATAHAHQVRVLLSIGGQTSSNAIWSDNVAPKNLGAFVTNIIALVQKGDGQGNGYDGVDIDWEFPSSSEDEANFSAFMKLLNARLKAIHSKVDEKPLNLTFFISAGGQSCYVDWPHIGDYCDYGILSGYAYGVDRFNGPLNDTATYYSCSIKGQQKGDIVHSCGQLFNAGFSPSKLILGCPLYAEGPGNPSDADVFASGRSITFYGPQAEAAYMYEGKTFIMDTHQSFCDKMNWIFDPDHFPKGQVLQGIALWDIGFAYPPNTNVEVTDIWSVIGEKSKCFDLSKTTPTVAP